MDAVHAVRKGWFSSNSVTRLIVYFDRKVCIKVEEGSITVSKDAFYYDSFQEGISVGSIVSQINEYGEEVSNPNGTVSVADFLAGVGTVLGGSNATSIDRVAGVDDFFSNGYALLCKSHASPFYRLYSKRELFNPITRCELAYLTVVCYHGVEANNRGLGVSFNWLGKGNKLGDFSDIGKYKIGVIVESESPVLDLRQYKGERSVERFMSDVKAGKSALPLPMALSLVELSNLGLFRFSDRELQPLRQVSRGEFSYFLSKLKEAF